jgi:hypothetical protein
MANLKPHEGERYSSTEEMRSEFGSYRVNDYTDKLCDNDKVTELSAESGESY